MIPGSSDFQFLKFYEWLFSACPLLDFNLTVLSLPEKHPFTCSFSGFQNVVKVNAGVQSALFNQKGLQLESL